VIGHYLRRETKCNLPRKTTVIQTVLAIELDHQSLLEVVWTLAHNLCIRVLEDMRSANLDVALARQNSQSGLRTEIDQLSPEVTLVLWHVLVQG
jgi:hypothetical protein